MFKRKKKTNTGIVEVITTQNKNEIAKIEASHKQGMELAQSQAKQDASATMPPLKGTSKIYLKFLLAFYNKIVAELKATIQLNHNTYAANKEIEEFNIKHSRLKNKLREVVSNLRIAKNKFEDLKSCVRVMNKYYWAQFMVVLLTMSELVLSSVAFQIALPNLAMSLLVGGVFAGALFVCSGIGARILRKAKNNTQFWLYLLGIIVVLSTLFWTLGEMRLSYLKQMSDNGAISEGLSPFVFCFFQLFLFMTAIMLKYFNTPTEQEKEQYYTWKQAKNNIVLLEKQQTTLEQEIKDIELQLKRSLLAHKTLISFVGDLEKKIDAMYHEAGNQYIKENMFKRNDSSEGIPQLFELDDPLEALTLYFQDQELLLNFNENTLNYE